MLPALGTHPWSTSKQRRAQLRYRRPHSAAVLARMHADAQSSRCTGRRRAGVVDRSTRNGTLRVAGAPYQAPACRAGRERGTAARRAPQLRTHRPAHAARRARVGRRERDITSPYHWPRRPRRPASGPRRDPFRLRASLGTRRDRGARGGGRGGATARAPQGQAAHVSAPAAPGNTAPRPPQPASPAPPAGTRCLAGACAFARPRACQLSALTSPALRSPTTAPLIGTTNCWAIGTTN